MDGRESWRKVIEGVDFCTLICSLDSASESSFSNGNALDRRSGWR